MDLLRRLSGIPLAGALLFVLPFVTFSCLGQDLASLTGLELVTGTSVEMPGDDGNPQRQEIPAESLALVALACGVAAGVLGLVLKSVRTAILPAVISAVAAVALLLLKSKIDRDVLANGEGMLQATYTWAFWLVVGAYPAGCLSNLLRTRRRVRSPAANSLPWPEPGT